MEWWQALLSGAAGGVLTLGGQWLTGRMTSAREAEARAHEREASRSDRREEFELERLIEARDRVRDAQRAARDLFVFRKKDIFAGNLTLPGLTDLSPDEQQLHGEKKQAMAELRAAHVLVLDDGCRRALEIAAEKLSRHATEDADDACEDAMTTIGARVRELMGRFA